MAGTPAPGRHSVSRAACACRAGSTGNASPRLSRRRGGGRFRLRPAPFRAAALRADERLALEVLLVPGLFPDQHPPGVLGALPEHGLRGLLPPVPNAAGRPRLFELLAVPVV